MVKSFCWRSSAVALNDYLSALVDLEFSKRFSNSVSTTSLENVLAISTKSLKPQQHAGETWEHYSIPAFDEMHWPIFELADGIKSNKYIVDRSSILISKLNPSTKRIWIPACLTDKAVCSTEFIVYKPLEPRHKSFYCAAISANSFTAFLLEHVTGSTGSRQRVQPKATLDYPMPNPCRMAIEAFCDFADPIYRQIEINEIESQRLRSLRNALLPKLMSGEINVSKIELPTQPNNHLVQSLKRLVCFRCCIRIPLISVAGQSLPISVITTLLEICFSVMRRWICWRGWIMSEASSCCHSAASWRSCAL